MKREEIRDVKRLLGKILVFLLPLVAILGYKEYELSKLPSSFLVHKQQLEKRIADTEVLVIGSSCARYGINPAYFSRPAFNLAHAGEDLLVTSQLARKFVPEMAKLKLLVVEINYDSLRYMMRDGPLWWRVPLYKKIYGIAGEEHGVFSQVARGNYRWLAMFTPNLGVNHQPNATSELKDIYDSNGWGGPETFRTVIDSPNQAPLLSLIESVMVPKNTAINASGLESLLALAKQRGLAVAFLITPTPELYRRQMKSDVVLELHEFIARSEREYGVKLFDLSADRRFTDSDFADLQHVAAESVEKLSRIVNSEVVEPMLKGAAR